MSALTRFAELVPHNLMMNSRTGVELEPVGQSGESETYRAHFDQDSTSASMAVVTALTATMDKDPVDLEPLSETIDTDALDAIVQDRGTTADSVHVMLTHEGREITVNSYGVVAVSPSDHNRAAGRAGETH